MQERQQSTTVPEQSLSVCVVTGTRAEYGILRELLRVMAATPEIALSLVVTGSHLSAEFGSTIREIEADGLVITEKVPMLVDCAPATSAAYSFGMGALGLASALDRLAPDLLLVLGDRYEVLAAASVALLLGIPIAHLCGGDVTEGANDDSMRHAISKLASLHFPSNEQSARRLRQMGEAAERVHVVGTPALDALRRMQFLDRDAFCGEVGLDPAKPFILFTMHPETHAADGGLAVLEATLAALQEVPTHSLLVTAANADAHGRIFNDRLRAFCAARADAVFYPSLGHRLYFNALKHAACMVGNSSSGLYEAPSFSLPVVNLGDRQAGRLRGGNVHDCPGSPDTVAIGRALAAALAAPPPAPDNPYGDGHASERIVKVLLSLSRDSLSARKHFVGQ